LVDAASAERAERLRRERCMVREVADGGDGVEGEGSGWTPTDF
jgi:hypothetical protein